MVDMIPKPENIRNKLDKGLVVFSLFTSVPHAVLSITKNKTEISSVLPITLACQLGITAQMIQTVWTLIWLVCCSAVRCSHIATNLGSAEHTRQG